MDKIHIGRALKETSQIAKLAERLGIGPPRKPYHVTLAYSRHRVDTELAVFQPIPTDMNTHVMRPVLSRMGGRFGPVALCFKDHGLEARFEQLVDAGVHWDYPTFHPHITLGRKSGRLDQLALQEFGFTTLLFGPEYRKIIT
jgi:2'-5' RNA ligase